MKKSCYYCGGKTVKKFGKTKQDKQRFCCLSCLKTYIWKRPNHKAAREQIWFKWWIKEGLSLRQISLISKHGREKLKRIKNKWLSEEPLGLYNKYKEVKYLIFDGTYFNRTNSLLLFMNDADNNVVSCCYVDSENYENTYKMAIKLKCLGVEPKSITLDGLKTVIEAVQDVWPKAKIQRCLYHIEHQGLMWLRRKPKTDAGRELRNIYKGITAIKTKKEKAVFTRKYRKFLKRHKAYIDRLSRKKVGYGDLKKATTLIDNAYKNMWHYLKDEKIPKTTNKLEGYISELKQQYGKHKGLSKRNRDNYFKWYCYYKNA